MHSVKVIYPINDWVCLRFPKQCIVGWSSLTCCIACSTSLWWKQRRKIQELSGFFINYLLRVLDFHWELAQLLQQARYRSYVNMQSSTLSSSLGHSQLTLEHGVQPCKRKSPSVSNGNCWALCGEWSKQWSSLVKGRLMLKLWSELAKQLYFYAENSIKTLECCYRARTPKYIYHIAICVMNAIRVENGCVK